MSSKYPDRLLPATGEKHISHPNPKELLCRWVSPDKDLKDESGFLNAEAVESKRIPFLSTNKIPRSLVEDVYIKFYDKKFEEPWEEGMPAVHIIEDDFELIKERSYFLFTIEDIQYKGTYPFPADGRPNNYEFEVTVMHKPLVSNYCHFEIYVYNNDKKVVIDKDTSKGWGRVIIADIRQKLIKIAKFSVEDFEE